MREEYLRIDNGKKVIEGQIELYSVFLQVYAGEIYGILSEDMYEVDSLVNILAGKDTFDYGKIYYKGASMDLETGREYLQKKIIVMDGQSRLVDNLSIAENLYFVEGKPERFFVHTDRINRRVKELLEVFHINIKAEASVKKLTYLEQCQLELLKAYVKKAECVIINQIKDFLTHTEYEKLHQLAVQLKNRGMTFITTDYSAQRTAEYSDAVMILNKGKTAQILEYGPFHPKELQRYLPEPKPFDKSFRQAGKGKEHPKPALEMRHIWTRALKDISLTAAKGEIVVIVCEDRKSIWDLGGLFTGNLQADQGDILVCGRKYRPRGRAMAIRQGICFMEHEFLADHLFHNMTVYDNICIAKGNLVKTLWWKSRYRKSVTDFIREIFGEDISQKKVKDLTPLEQKKVLYYRWMLYKPDVVVCINPFSAADAVSIGQIEQMLMEYAEKGIGVLLLMQDYRAGGELNASRYVLENMQLIRV